VKYDISFYLIIYNENAIRYRSNHPKAIDVINTTANSWESASVENLDNALPLYKTHLLRWIKSPH
jgi:hypothetical protein